MSGGAKSRRFAWILVAGSVWLNLLFFIDFRENVKYSDFTVFYTAGTILREGLGHQLYDRRVQFRVQEEFAGHVSFRRGPLPYIHPPFEAILFVPLSRLTYQHAFIVWDLLNLALLFAIAAVLRKSVGVLALIPPWQFAIASIAFFPVVVCLLEGQDSILLLLLCALGFNALKQDADFLAGCWLALGAFKFQFIVPIILLLYFWKRRRVGLGFGVVAILLALASIALVGKDALLHYPEYALQIVNTPGLGGVPPGLLPNLHGLAVGWPKPFSGIMGIALGALSSVLVFVFAALTGRANSKPGKLELRFSLAVAVSGLIAWQTNLHDLSMLILPLVLITDLCFHSMASRPKVRFALLHPVLPLLISPLWMALWLVTGKVNLVTIPLLWWVWKIGKELSQHQESVEYVS